MSKRHKITEAVILLVDVNESVGQQICDGQSFLSKSKQCASRIIQRKICSDSHDQFSLILIGSERTDNELDYPNIDVRNKWMVPPNFNLLKEIDNLSSSHVTNADWLDGLIVAINLLKSESECKQLTDLKIVMMSNFSAPLRSKDQVNDVINSLKHLQIKLVIIGPESDGDEGTSKAETNKSKIQMKGEALVGRIVNEVDGLICGFDEAMAQLQNYQNVTAKPAAWYCDLQIGMDIFIPIIGYKKMAEKNLFPWKKRTIDNSPITHEAVYYQGDTQVDKADLIDAYLFGQSVIPISSNDKASIVMETEKCFQVIGFTKKKNVPRHILLGNSVDYIVPKIEIQAAEKAVTALAKALLELDMAGIVRKIRSKRSAPEIGVLLPTFEADSFFFYYAVLPFAEDERMLRLPSMARVQPSSEQLSAVDKLIDDMDLSHFEEDEDPYCKLINPTKKHKFNMIISKAMDPHSKLSMEPTEEITKLIQPEEEVLNNALKALEEIKVLFPLEEIEQKNYRKGAADVFDRNSTTSDNMELADIKPQNLADSIASFVQSTVTEIGTIDPEGNFHKLQDQGEPFIKLFEQMKTAIAKLFLSTSSTTATKKPLSALSLLRKESITKAPCDYNNFIASIKDQLIERNSYAVWELIVQERLGLITSKEAHASNVSTEEGELFYELKEVESHSEIDIEMEAEDMLDMI